MHSCTRTRYHNVLRIILNTFVPTSLQLQVHVAILADLGADERSHRRANVPSHGRALVDAYRPIDASADV